MTTTDDRPAGGGQAAPAGDLGERRLLGRGHPDRSRRRAARRPRGSACRLTRARRRDRQRERSDRRRPAAVRGRRDRLRRGSARPRPRAGCRRRPGDRPPRRRRRGAALPRLVVRRGPLGVRLDVRAQPRADRRRDRPRHPARRDDRARKLDAGRLPRRPLPRRRAVRAAPGRRRLTDAVGVGRPPRLAVRPGRPLDAHDRDLHLPLPDRGGVRRLLRRALRPDAEGDRSCRRPRRTSSSPPSPSWCGPGTDSTSMAPSRSRRRIWPPSASE